MDLLLPSPGLLIWQIFVFLVLVYILGKYAWKPIMASLAEREGEIESALKMAEETRAEMAKLKADNDKLIIEARKERDMIIKEAREAADKVIATSKETAIVQGNKILEDARDSMAQERVKMLSQIRKDVATLSIEIAEKVIRKELADKKTQQTFVDELISDAKLN
jgi:F-type H+-transporting ATPase subunit b